MQCLVHSSSSRITTPLMTAGCCCHLTPWTSQLLAAGNQVGIMSENVSENGHAAGLEVGGGCSCVLDSMDQPAFGSWKPGAQQRLCVQRHAMLHSCTYHILSS
jgi:hypothetical protein